MRRLIPVSVAIFTATLLVSFATISAGAQTTSQYTDEDTTAQESTAQQPSSAALEDSSTEGTVSEGSTGGASASAEELAIMEPSEPYSQVVDNAAPERFSAQGWKESTEGSLYYGEGYTYSEPSEDAAPARFKVDIPATDYYTVYARWPARKVNTAAARFGISTVSGTEWTVANQQKDGGMWIRLGAYQMNAGDEYAVQVSPKTRDDARVVADAVMVVRGTQVAPPEDTATSSDSSRLTASGSGPNGRDVVRVGRNHIGTRYRKSPPHPCRAFRSEDCSCFTKLVFKRFGRPLPDSPVKQWRRGNKVGRAHLRPGDLVFFKEGRSRVITHVAIYAGGGDIVHASRYWGRVVERPMKYVDGYFGAKRIRLP